MAAKARVLFVDDEPHVLSAIRRSLHKEFDVHTAESAHEALRLIQEDDPFSVIVADCRMPKMNGIELLARASRLAPDAVRIMLTGNTDQQTAVDALNTGEIFKFLNKPCSTELLRGALSHAVRQHQLVTAERELLEKTLNGSIKVLGQLLSIAKPEAFGRTDRIQRKAREIAAHVEGTKMWELEAAALLSQLGCIRLPESVLEKITQGKPLTPNEASEFAAHPTLGAELIEAIPRLEAVARIVLYQNKHFDGNGWPKDDIKQARIPLEARILHAVLTHDELTSQGWTDAAVVAHFAAHPGRIDPTVLAALKKSGECSAIASERRVLASELQVGMILQEDVRNDRGVMLLTRGLEITPALYEHLVRLQKKGSLTARFLVTVPG